MPSGQGSIDALRRLAEWMNALEGERLEFKEAKQRVIDAFEAAYLKSLLDKFGGNISRSAQAAGLTRYHLRALAKRYGIHGDPET